MLFSVAALSLASVALAADAISQIDDGQIQATTATSATTSATTSAPTTAETASSSSTLIISTQTENGANQVAGGAALAGLVAAGAMLI